MSLVICSNQYDGIDYDKRSYANSPFSFTNSLKQTMIVPPHSAVALQSIKINKDGLLSLSPGDAWYMYFGANLISSTTNSLNTPYSPIRAAPELTDSSLSEDVNMNVWCERIAKGFNRGVPHPDAYGFLTFTPHRTGGLGFLGYSIVTDYANDQSGTNNRPDSWQSAYLLDDGLTYDHAAKTLTGFSGNPTSTATFGPVDENTSIMTKYPLSHNNGSMDVDITNLQGAKSSFTTHWQVGLNRACTGTNSYANQSSFFTGDQSTGFHQNGFNENQFDFVVSCDQTADGSDRYLKVHHMIDTPFYNGCTMTEIEYWNFVGNDWSSARYNMSTNSAGYDSLRFTVKNEVVMISIGVGMAGFKKIASFENRALLGAGKTNYPKPAAQSCWNLYPKITILGGPTKSCEFVKWGGRVNAYDDMDYESQNGDWVNRMSAQGLENSVVSQMDQGYWNDMLDVTEYVQRENDAAGGKNLLADTEIQTIVSPSIQYFNGTDDANMSNKWGFQSRPVLSTSSGAVAHGDRGYKYISDQVPEITSTSSLFVRLDDLTQKSVNAGVGRPSKIIYHLPRFDNSNREVGTGLYYEPGQRTYLCLDNSEPLQISDFKISICNESERLARDLTGKTIICLHFIKDREKKDEKHDEVRLIQ